MPPRGWLKVTLSIAKSKVVVPSAGPRKVMSTTVPVAGKPAIAGNYELSDNAFNICIWKFWIGSLKVTTSGLVKVGSPNEAVA
jgi:hypothetical protein